MENNHSEEIDLASVLRSIKNNFGNLLQRFGKSIRFFIKNIKTFVIFITIGVGISIGVFSLIPTVYVTNFTLSHTRLNNAQCADLVNGLTIAPNKNLVLVKKLGIDIKMAEQIKSISYISLNKNTDIDSIPKFFDFKIEVKVYDPSVLDTVQKKILNFLESNEYATKRKEINRLYLDKYEANIKSEIIAIDSLKRIVDKSIIPRSMGNGIILGESIDPVKVYQEGMNLYKSQLNINEQRELNDSFEIIVGFSPVISSTSMTINIFIGFISGFILGIFWLFRKKVM